MIPFRLTFQPGIPIHEQVSFAARKAMLSGQLRPGDPFPSVRALSKALKINPNTAHKVVTQLTADGLLEVRAGVGTVVARPPESTRAERSRLLGREVEQLAVEARRLGLTMDEVQGGFGRALAKARTARWKGVVTMVVKTERLTPRQFGLPLDRPLRALSQGMRVKAALASSLPYRPKLLVLDERFSGLDVLVRGQLIECILERATETNVCWHRTTFTKSRVSPATSHT